MKNLYLFDANGACFLKATLQDDMGAEHIAEMALRNGAINHTVLNEQHEIDTVEFKNGALKAKVKVERVKTYIEERFNNYPSVRDQLGALWDAMNTGLLPKVPAFYDPIAAIKLQYPKPKE